MKKYLALGLIPMGIFSIAAKLGCGQVVEPISSDGTDGGRVVPDSGASTFDSGIEIQDGAGFSCTGIGPSCPGCCGESISPECTDAGWACPWLGCPVGICDAGSSVNDAGIVDAAGNESDACATLQAAAENTFQYWSYGTLRCTTDTDCVWTQVPEQGACTVECGTDLTDKSSAAYIVDAAVNACAAFNAMGCPLQLPFCPVTPPITCAAGVCATYGLTLTQSSPSITHGQCAVFDATYHQPGVVDAGAPHDFGTPLSATDGTLYVDSMCTTPLTTGTLTIPSGATGVSFGFVPTAAGTFQISLGQNASAEFVAQ
jgi:hypothetical protein